MDSDDITVIKPRPGRRSGNTPAPAADQTVIKPRPRPGGAQAPAKPFAQSSDATIIKPRKQRPNNLPLNLRIPSDRDILKQSPLIDAASPILSLTPQLRQIDVSLDVFSLHAYIKTLIENFQTQTLTILDDAAIRKNASYILCALIDETVLNTTWGENSAWSQKPMLSLFHRETYGGEKFYTILDEALTAPVKYRELLEIIYLAMSLGFMGKLRIDNQGPMKVEQMRAQLYDVLNRSRDKFHKDISVHTDPANSLKRRLHSFLPVWLFIASAILLGFGVYTYQLLELNKHSDTTRAMLAQLIPQPEQAKLPVNFVPPELIALRELLAPEIQRGILSVTDYTTHTSIVLHSEELFASGSTAIKTSFEPVLDKIAKALEAIPGRIVVSGHTDNISIRTPRFPSNWHLSLARASAVVKYMDSSASLQTRLLPEGRGADEPVESNDTSEGRAKNRRVVIDVFFNDLI